MAKRIMPKKLYVIEHETEGGTHVAGNDLEDLLGGDVDKVVRVGTYRLVSEEDLVLELTMQYDVVKAKDFSKRSEADHE